MSFYRRIANLFSRSSVEREIEAELEAHIAMRTEDNITAGMAPEAANGMRLFDSATPPSLRNPLRQRIQPYFSTASGKTPGTVFMAC